MWNQTRTWALNVVNAFFFEGGSSLRGCGPYRDAMRNDRIRSTRQIAEHWESWVELSCCFMEGTPTRFRESHGVIRLFSNLNLKPKSWDLFPNADLLQPLHEVVIPNP